MPIRVLIADDHPITRSGIQTTLQGCGKFVIVGQTATSDEVLHLVRELQPDVLTLDLTLSGLETLFLIEQVRCEKFPTKILIFSENDDPFCMSEAIEAGAHGYLAKDVEAEEFVSALKAIARGDTWMN
jgi:two-component system, NarL family, nitrate/nitrite response regulator NarL